MPVRLILSRKIFCSYFLGMMYVEFMINFLLADSGEQMPFRLHYGLQSPKTFDSYFLDMMYFELMKNFLLADSNEQMPVRLITAS